MIYDALVIGGGPAGSTVGWLLAKAGWNVVLLEKSIFPRRKVCGEFISATNLPLLQILGLKDYFLDMAGPPVREVGLYCGTHRLTASMPVYAEDNFSRGRALGREHLDTELLQGAHRAGVNVIQPCAVTGLVRDQGFYTCMAKPPGSHATFIIEARVVIAAHGSWEKGKLPTHNERQSVRASDLMAFKAHFVNADLPDGVMPLLAFPGGYGGLVNSDQGRVSLSCCVRRDTLQQLRTKSGSQNNAAEAVFAHLMENNLGLRNVLRNTKTSNSWLATGPIQPGIRTLYKDGIFAVGNTAGEAHPIIAEGISMAMQGAWLLSETLLSNSHQVLRSKSAEAGKVYSKAWKRSFASRIYNAAWFANLAMRPAVTTTLLPLFRWAPELLTYCTHLSGKTRKIVPAFSWKI